ncbi:MAG: D-alanine--D-alanine ligase [Bacteroidota bacterium]
MTTSYSVAKEKKRPRFLRTKFFIRLLHWEYWPTNVVYAPIILYWLWLCAKARSFFFFSASNPTIEYGGLTMESKFDIYNLVPKKFQPKTILVVPGQSPETIISAITEAGFQYPLFVKPDVGGKGLAVKKTDNENDLVNYLVQFNVPMLVQEAIPFKEEAGIFYYRLPGSSAGKISGIVMKDYLTVTGDGVSTIYELLMQNARYILQIPALKQMMGAEMLNVLTDGEVKVLVPVGNHARGSKFIDATRLVNEELEKTIDSICQQIPGFYFGRMDIKFNSIEELQQGKNFSIIELNGAGSEPTHMYDPAHSIFFAWKEIIRHWKIMYKVSTLNHRQGIPYMSYKAGRKMFRDEKEYFKYMNEVLEKGSR